MKKWYILPISLVNSTLTIQSYDKHDDLIEIYQKYSKHGLATEFDSWQAAKEWLKTHYYDEESRRWFIRESQD